MPEHKQRGEKRACSLQNFSVREEARGEAETAGKMILEGYAVIFESEEMIGDVRNGGFYEIIDRNAFNGCNMKDVPLKIEHADTIPILARTRNKSLQLTVDEKGLKVRAELLDTQNARDMYEMIRAGLYDSMSFAFTVAENGEEISTRNGVPVRRITKFERIFDVSVVNMPAYSETSIFARSIDLAKSWTVNQERAENRNEIKILLKRWA